MSYEFIKVEKEDHLTILTVNRPEVLNCISAPTSVEMDQALNDFEQDPEAWLLILTGAGEKAFSAGMDLKWFSEYGVEEYRRMTAPLKGLGGITQRLDCNKPMIAAVNGLAFGGGFEMALSCDIILAAEHATFALPEPKVGIMAGAGGAVRLPRRIPYYAAMSILLTGRRITAAEAASLGLVAEVVPGDQLMAAARRWAAMVLECAPLAIRASKEVASQSLDLPLSQALTTVFPAQKTLFQSQDAVEGPKAFAAKRKPQWKGR